MELKKQGYIVQTAAYLRNSEYENAYGLAKQFVEKFPDEMAAHYLLSQASFWTSRFDEAVLEGSKAFNKCNCDDDMLACALVAASAYYELEKFDKGFHLLMVMGGRKKSEELEKLMFLFSLARNDAEEAALHLN
jgi:hypothetical protein